MLYNPAPCDQAPHICPYNSQSAMVCDYFCGFDANCEEENPYENENSEEE